MFLPALFLGMASSLGAQSDTCELHTRALLPHKAVYSDADRRCDPARKLTDSIHVDIANSGFYRIHLLSRYSIGADDVQLNESYFVTVRQAGSGQISYPIDANVAKSRVDSVDANGDSVAYKIVLDDNTLTSESVMRDAGLFFMESGLHIIEIFHYAVIAEQFPQFENSYADTAFSDPCYEALTPPVVSGHLGGKYSAESVELDSLAVEQVDCKAYDLTFAKSATRDTVLTQNDTLAYMLSVTNHGDGDAFDLAVRDTLPPFVTPFDFSVFPDSIDNNILAWRLGFLPKDSSATFSYTVAVEVLPVDSSLTLVNRGAVLAANDSATANNHAQAEVIATPKQQVPQYDLSFDKLASRDTVFTTGDSLRYNLLVRNHGPNTAFGIAIADTLPPHISAMDFTIPPDSIKNGVLHWSLDSLTVTQSVLISYTALIDVSPADTILALVNRAGVRAPNDTLAANDSKQQSVIAVPRPEPEPAKNYDLSLEKSASADSVNTRSGSIDYGLVVVNHGPNTAYEVILADTLPPFVRPTWFSHPPTRVAGNVIEWRFDSLAVDFATQVSLIATVEVTPADTIFHLVNRGVVHASSDTLLANNASQVSVIARAEPANYDLILTKTASKDSVFTGADSLEYALTLRNAGPGNAANFTVSDTLPPFVTASRFNRQPDTMTGRLLEWRFENLPADSAATISYTAHLSGHPADTTFALQNIALLNAPRDTVAANNAAQSTVAAVPRPPLIYRLDIRKVANADTVRPGQVFSYTISVTNSGDASISEFTVRDILPPQISLDIVSRYFPRPPDAISGDTLSWTFGALTAGTTQMIIFDVASPAMPMPGLAEIANVAEVSVPEAIPFAGSRDSTIVTVVAKPVLECYLDRNVWHPAIDPALGVNFGLSSSSAVRIKIHDLSGTLIRDLLNQPYGSGQHRIEWDGRSDSGLPAGSGVYVVTYESQQFIDWKKLIIVR